MGTGQKTGTLLRRRVGMRDGQRPPRPGFTDRYRPLPTSVLLAQLFLGVGWLRSGVAHALSPDWWTGDELDRFLVDQQIEALDWYAASMFSALDEPTLGAAVSGAIMVSQLIIGVMLLSNFDAVPALAVGSFMNLNFVLAGVVSPSIFYLLLSMVIVIWHAESQWSPERGVWLSAVSTSLLGFLLVALVPEIRMDGPGAAVDDPALVLLFVAALFAGAAWASLFDPTTYDDRAIGLGRSRTVGDAGLDRGLDGQGVDDIPLPVEEPRADVGGLFADDIDLEERYGLLPDSFRPTGPADAGSARPEFGAHSDPPPTTASWPGPRRAERDHRSGEGNGDVDATGRRPSMPDLPPTIATSSIELDPLYADAGLDIADGPRVDPNRSGEPAPADQAETNSR